MSDHLQTVAAPYRRNTPAQLAREVAKQLGMTPSGGGTHEEPMAEWQLVDQGRAGETDILQAYAAVTGLPVADDDAFHGLAAFPGVSQDFLAFHGCLPLRWDNEHVVLAVSNPYSFATLEYQWDTMFGLEAEFVLARRSVVEHRLASVYEQAGAEEGSLDADGQPSEEALKDLAQEAPIVRLVNDVLNRAVEMRASDIHVEPAEDELAIRYRIDGMLQTIMNPPLSYYAAIASRLKLMANMNIAERRLPQDGRIDTTVAGRRIDVRVSTVPTMQGESIVLRLLEKETALLDLDAVGLEGNVLEKFRKLVQMPYGMILVVGPTGSGKTTTLYSAMKMVNSEDRKIITIEDPVEYQIRGLAQIQVRPQIGLSFANGLRSIVRQDPDIILVGEIRDRETAEIAVHAALTGHLVFSTLHTNDAAGAISRLLEMGIEGFLISSALLGVASQRLVRTICPDCRGRVAAQGETDAASDARCRTCRGTGFHGRTGIFELLVVDDALRQAINERRDSTELARLARKDGMKSLYEDGQNKVDRAITTMAEVARVCQMGETG